MRSKPHGKICPLYVKKGGANIAGHCKLYGVLRYTKRPLKLITTVVIEVGAIALATFWTLGEPHTDTNLWTAPIRAARKQNPIPATEKTIGEGKDLFLQACFPCHGLLGKGDGPAAAALERKPGNLSDPKLWEQPDGAIFWKISEGKTPMPSFGETYSEEQRWLIINFVRTLAPRANPQTHNAQKGNQ